MFRPDKRQMTTGVYVCPLGGDVSPPPRADLKIVAYGPRDAVRLRRVGWDVVDMVAAFDDTRQRQALEDGVTLGQSVQAAAIDAGFSRSAGLQFACETVRQLAGWRRFEAALDGADRVEVLGYAGVLDAERAFEMFVAERETAPGRWSWLALRLLRWANRVAIHRAGERPHLVETVAGSFPVNISETCRAKFRHLRIRLMTKPRWDKILKAVLEAVVLGRAVVAVPVAENHARQASVGKFARTLRALDLPPPVAKRLVSWAHMHAAADVEIGSAFAAASRVRLCAVFQGILPRPQPAHSAIAENVARVGGAVVNFTHGSIVSHGDATEKEALATAAAAGWIWSPATTDVFPRSPLADSGDDQSRARVHPAVYRTRSKELPSSARGGSFRILHAGNYLGWARTPWVAPNEFEYYRALHDCAGAVEGLENVELSIRIKTTTGLLTNDPRKMQQAKLVVLDPDTFFEEAGERRGLSRSEEPSIIDAILAADLVITEGWTSVMHDALELGRPVLLHTLSDRFAHMPARRELPSEADRDAVYACNSEALTEMLEAIVAAHKGRPLEAAEVGRYRWPATAPEAGEALERVLLDFAASEPDGSASFAELPSRAVP